jgi:11-cis-retinol dehydrogenase
VIIYYVSSHLYEHFLPSPDIDPNGKYVLISGCDSGFGHGLALEFDKQGFNVLAGVYLADSVTSLENKLSPKATVFRLDITKEEDINAAFELVQKKTNTLHALVNNAGIAGGTLIDWTSMETMRKVMDVNFFGHVAMTKKFLPLLTAKRGSRVVNMSSMLGFFSIPGSSSECVSKYALESFSDCLRMEMAPWNLNVSIIEPGTMRTPIIKGIDDNIRNSWNQLSNDIQERWGVNFLNNTIIQSINSLIVINAENPDKVIRAVQHAVMSTNPRLRYRPGWQSKTVFLISYICPTKIMDKLRTLGGSSTPASVRNQLMD